MFITHLDFIVYYAVITHFSFSKRCFRKTRCANLNCVVLDEENWGGVLLQCYSPGGGGVVSCVVCCALLTTHII